MYLNNKFILTTIVICLICIIKHCATCNEAICASIVSKCMLLQRCNCTLINCSCCKECFLCLNHLYSECCSCVNMCPQPNITNNPLGKKSYIEDLNQPVPALFEALTNKPDSNNRWTSINFPVDYNIRIFFPNHQEETEYYTKTNKDEYHPLKPNSITLNCTVAYMTNCSSWNKCKISCQSMGAKSYRWFHDGCCECIRDTCINYGINESKCENCPTTYSDLEEEISEDFDDYGQYEDYSYDYPINKTSLFDMLH